MVNASSVYSGFRGFVPGHDVGVSNWVRIDQEMITQFGHTTLDPDPMHIDPDWAQANSPYGDTIAFGFLTASLLTHLLQSAIKSVPEHDPEKLGHILNYGIDRLRWLEPVRVGSRVRGHFKTIELRQTDRAHEIVKFECFIEIEGKDKPALVAEWLGAWIRPGREH